LLILSQNRIFASRVVELWLPPSAAAGII